MGRNGSLVVRQYRVTVTSASMGRACKSKNAASVAPMPDDANMMNIGDYENDKMTSSAPAAERSRMRLAAENFA